MNQQLNRFIPKVIVLGNESDLPRDFPAKFEIVGHLDLKKVGSTLAFSLDGTPIDVHKICDCDFDYLLCTDEMSSPWMKHVFFNNRIVPFGIFSTPNFFRYCVSNVGFVALDNLNLFFENLRDLSNVNLILDADAYLIRSNVIELPPPPKKFPENF